MIHFRLLFHRWNHIFVQKWIRLNSVYHFKYKKYIFQTVSRGGGKRLLKIILFDYFCGERKKNFRSIWNIIIHVCIHSNHNPRTQTWKNAKKTALNKNIHKNTQLSTKKTLSKPNLLNIFAFFLAKYLLSLDIIK